jgi:hypothetical protein
MSVSAVRRHWDVVGIERIASHAHPKHKMTMLSDHEGERRRSVRSPKHVF